jgi:hypothetical protein
VGPWRAVRSAADVVDRYVARMRHLRHERFLTVLVDAKNRVLRDDVVGDGGLSSVPVHPREAFGPALREGASGVVFVHNHPSGDPEPSPVDDDLTRRLLAVGELLGIRVLDHIAIGDGRFVSYRDRGIVPPRDRPAPPTDDGAHGSRRAPRADPRASGETRQPVKPAQQAELTEVIRLVTAGTARRRARSAAVGERAAEGRCSRSGVNASSRARTSTPVARKSSTSAAGVAPWTPRRRAARHRRLPRRRRQRGPEPPCELAARGRDVGQDPVGRVPDVRRRPRAPHRVGEALDRNGEHPLVEREPVREIGVRAGHAWASGGARILRRAPGLAYPRTRPRPRPGRNRTGGAITTVAAETTVGAE